MTPPESLETDDALSKLGGETHDVDDRTAARIRRRSQVALARSTRLSRTPLLASLDRVYNRAIEPALVAAASAVYLAWAIAKVLHLI